MFGKRTDATDGKNRDLPNQKPAAPQASEHPAGSSDVDFPDVTPQAAENASPPEAPPVESEPPAPAEPPAKAPEATSHTDDYYAVKSTIFNALIDTIDLTQLAQLDAEHAREEIRDIVNEIIAIKNVVMSISEQEALLEDICNDVLGYGPLEPLLARDESPTLWSMVLIPPLSKSKARSLKPTCVFATTPSL